MNYFRACKEYKKLNKRTKSAFFQNIYSQLDEINETNPKLFWKTIDKIKKCGKTPQQKAIKKDKWENHLKNVLKENETISDSKFDFKTDTYIEKLNSPISCKEVRKALKSLKKY
jgi:hypothetical protein